jgi:flagellar hook-associated protein 1 FlgK
MSLTLSLNNALSGLRTNQSALNVLSQNISNTNTEGYSRQIVNLEPLTVVGVGAGVRISEITRNLDLYLQRAIRSQTAQVGQDEVISEYDQRIQLILGEPTSDTSLNAYVDNFFNAVQDFADNPELVSIRETMVRTAETLTRNTSELALGLEDLRFEADQDLERAINNTNQILSELYEVNLAIANANSFGQNKSGLFDERDNLIEDLAELMDIRVLTQDDGQAYVSANGGIPLVDYGLYQLTYNQAVSVDVFTGNAPLGQVDVILVDPDTKVEIGTRRDTLFGIGVEGSVTTNQETGAMRGLVDLRDVRIPEILNTLDEFAQELRDEINALHNSGGGFPPLAQMNGQREIDPAQVREWLGEFRLGVVNEDGSPIDSFQNLAAPGTLERGPFRPMTLTFGFDSGEGGPGLYSNQTLMDEINAYFGTQGDKVQLENMSDIKLVALDENNPPGGPVRFDFDLENITRDAADFRVLNVAPSSGATTTVFPSPTETVIPGAKRRTGLDLSFDLAGYAAGPVTFNIDVEVTNATTGAVSVSTLTYTVDLSVADIKNDRFVATAATGPGQVIPRVSTGPVARALLVDSQGNPVATGEDGFLRIETLNSSQRLVFDEMNSRDNGRLFADPFEVGTQRGFSHYFGLNNFFNENDNLLNGGDDNFVNSAYDFSVRDDIRDNPSLVSAGTLVEQVQPANPNDGPLYTFEHNVGNKRIAQQMADLANRRVNFDSAGLLDTTGDTFSNYSSSFLGAVSSRAKFSTLAVEQSQFLLDGMVNRQDGIKGVNLDEELANTVIYQNAYAATARVITVVNEMFEALLGIR